MDTTDTAEKYQKASTVCCSANVLLFLAHQCAFFGRNFFYENLARIFASGSQNLQKFPRIFLAQIQTPALTHTYPACFVNPHLIRTSLLLFMLLLLQASLKTSRCLVLFYSSASAAARRLTSRRPSRCCRPCHGPHKSRSWTSVVPTSKVRRNVLLFLAHQCAFF